MVAESGGAGPDAPSPAARRLRPPSWLDLRLVLGVLMVLVAVLIGARVVASADHSTTIWALSRDVASGTKLTAGDLRRERVRLFEHADRYLATSSRPIGRVVNRDLAAGDLLPGAALSAGSTGVLLPLAVDQDNVPPGLQHGDRIDVYVLPAADDRAGQTRRVLAAAVVQSVSGVGGSGLSGGSTKAALTVQVAADAEDGVVTRLAAGTLYVVQRFGAGAPSAAADDRSTAAPPRDSEAPRGPSAGGSAGRPSPSTSATGLGPSVTPSPTPSTGPTASSPDR